MVITLRIMWLTFSFRTTNNAFSFNFNLLLNVMSALRNNESNSWTKIVTGFFDQKLHHWNTNMNTITAMRDVNSFALIVNHFFFFQIYRWINWYLRCESCIRKRIFAYHHVHIECGVQSLWTRLNQFEFNFDIIHTHMNARSEFRSTGILWILFTCNPIEQFNFIADFEDWKIGTRYKKIWMRWFDRSIWKKKKKRINNERLSMRNCWLAVFLHPSTEAILLECLKK